MSRLLRLLALSAFAFGLGGTHAIAATKAGCSSGTTEFRQGGVRLFGVGRGEGRAYYVCSPKLRRPALAFRANSNGFERPRGVRRFPNHLAFTMVIIGAESSASYYSWIDLRDGTRRFATMADDEVGIAGAMTVREDGAMALVFDAAEPDGPGKAVFFRNGRKNLGRPVALGTLTSPGTPKTLALTDTALTWTGTDGTPGELALTERCTTPSCEIRLDLIEVTGAPRRS